MTTRYANFLETGIMVSRVLVTRSTVLVALFLAVAGCGDFAFEIEVAPVSTGVQVFADDVLVEPDPSDRVTVVRSFADYGEGMADGHIAVRVLSGSTEVFSQVFVPMLCARDGDDWDSETLYLSVVEEATTMVSLSGYECREGDKTIVGVF